MNLTPKERIQQQIQRLEVALEREVSVIERSLYETSIDALRDALGAMGGRAKKIPVDRILELWAGGMAQEAIARELKVSLSSVRREIVKKRDK